jgi:hypothetical protein
MGKNNDSDNPWMGGEINPGMDTIQTYPMNKFIR